MKYIYILILAFVCVCAFISSCKIHKDKKITIEKFSEIRISEEIVPVGNIFQCIMSSDSQFVMLDIEASDIKQFDFKGNYVKTLVRRGDGPGQVLAPRGIGLNNNFLLVADFATNSTKIYKRNGEYIGQIFPDGFSIVMGNIRFISESLILHGASSDARGYSFAGIILDTSGSMLRKVTKYPKSYDDYKRLNGMYYCDVNNAGSYVISFAKSPDIFIGNIKDGSFKTFEEKKRKYISEKRQKNGENAVEAEYEELINLGIHFLSDSIIVRFVGKTTREAEKAKSFLLFNEKKVEFMSIEGDFFSELQVSGRLLCTFGEFLIFEENDTPNNRRLSFYKYTVN